MVLPSSPISKVEQPQNESSEGKEEGIKNATATLGQQPGNLPVSHTNEREKYVPLFPNDGESFLLSPSPSKEAATIKTYVIRT
jgi:hypothetical protein